MRILGDTLQNLLASVGPPSVRCWRMTLARSGEVIGLTKHTRNLMIDGLTYFAELAGIRDTTIETSEGASVDNMELTAFLSRVDEARVHAGEYDGAQVEVFDVDPLNLSAGIIPLKVGVVGAARVIDGQASVEVRGPGQLLQTKIGELFTTACPVPLGSPRCKVFLYDITVADDMVLVAATSTITALSTDLEARGWKVGGHVQVSDSSANDGLYTIAALDTFTVIFQETLTGGDESGFFTMTYLSGYLYTGTIATVDAQIPRRGFTTSPFTRPDGSVPPPGWFQEGHFRFTSGLNQYAAPRFIRTHSGVAFTLYEELPYDAQVGDAFILETGCDKLPSTCKDKFQNFINYQGFPDIPTPEDIFNSPVGL